MNGAKIEKILSKRLGKQFKGVFSYDQWRSLKIGAVFHVIDRITIPTVPELKHYVVLQTEQQQIIHVWITDIMNKELLKYNLTMGNVFIKPLGKKKSKTSEFEYYDFDIVVDVVNSLNFM